jgi:hypothetical protein
MGAFHKQAKPLERQDVDVMWVAMLVQHEGWMWVFAFQGEYNIHLYGRLLVFAHNHKLEHLVSNNHTHFFYFPFPQAILM